MHQILTCDHLKPRQKSFNKVKIPNFIKKLILLLILLMTFGIFSILILSVFTWCMSPKFKLKNYPFFWVFTFMRFISSYTLLLTQNFGVKRFSVLLIEVLEFPSFCVMRHLDGLSIQSFINWVKTFFRVSRIWNIAPTWSLARPFTYLSPFISQILDFLYWMVSISIFDDIKVKKGEFVHCLEWKY